MMKKENLPILILIASVILLLLIVTTSKNYDFGFWGGIITNVFIILGTLKTIKNKKAKKL